MDVFAFTLTDGRSPGTEHFARCLHRVLVNLAASRDSHSVRCDSLVVSVLD